jgi:hypothetical protein
MLGAARIFQSCRHFVSYLSLFEFGDITFRNSHFPSIPSLLVYTLHTDRSCFHKYARMYVRMQGDDEYLVLAFLSIISHCTVREHNTKDYCLLTSSLGLDTEVLISCDVI